jgi:hypothetical protein
MAEDLQYTIRFKTTAEGNGAKETLAEINAITNAQKRVMAGRAEEQFQAKGLASANYNLSYSYREAKTASDAAGSSQSETRNTVEELANGATKAGKESSKFGQNMLQAAYAADDLQYGMRGIVNNVPMLAQAFGMSASWAGGIAILAVALNQLLPLLTSAGDGMANLKETSSDVLTNAANAAISKLDKRKAELEDEQKRLKLSLTPDTAGDDAKQKALDAYAAQIQTIADVTQQLNQLLGRQTTALETMAAQEQADAAKREASAQAAIDAENRKVEAARTALLLAQQERENKERLKQDAIFAAEEADKQVKRLQQQKDLLDSISGQRVGLAEALAQGGVLPGQKTAAAERAGQDLGNVNIQLDAAAVQANTFRDTAGKLTQTLARYDDAIETAAQALERQQAASKQNIDTILQQQGVSAAADDAKNLQGATSEISKQLTSAVGMAKEQVGVAGETAKEIESLLKDGLTTEELKKIPALVQTLVGTYKGDVQALQEVLKGVIEAAGLTASQTAQLQRDVADLKKQAANRGAGSP